MHLLVLILGFVCFSEAFKYHIGPRLASGERERYASLLGIAEVNARMPTVGGLVANATIRGTSKPSRALLHFDTASLATEWWKQYTIDEADLELELGEVVCRAKYQVLKLMTPETNLSGATWDCPRDAFLEDFGSECSSFWEGGAFSTYSEESSITLRETDSHSTVRIPITSIARGNPQFLMVRRAVEASRSNNLGIEGNKCRATVLAARLAIRTYALNPTTQRRLGDRVPEGCEYTPKTINFEGQDVTISAYTCPTTRDIPDGADVHTMVRTLGVPWQDGAFLDTGIYSEVGDEIFISQRCQGPSECKLAYRNSTNGVDIRGAFMTQLIFDDPNGFHLKKGTVAINGQDQGSMNNLAFGGDLVIKNRLNDLSLITDFEGWSGIIWCLCQLQKLGQCITAFGSKCFGDLGIGFLKEFSQDGGYDDTNPATSVGAYMHLTLNYFYGYNRTHPFCGGAAEAALRARNPVLSAELGPASCAEFSYDGFLNHRIELPTPQEITHAQSYWAEGAPEWQDKRFGTGRWFPMNLGETEDCPEVNGTTNPECDQEQVRLKERNLYPYRSSGVSHSKLTHRYLTSVGTALSQQPRNGRPGSQATYFISGVWQGLFASFDFDDAIVVDGKFTGSRFCGGPGAPGTPGACPVSGMCEEGRCPTGGHSTFGNFGIPSPDYFALRSQYLQTSSTLNRVLNEIGSHVDPNSGSNNARAWAKAWESAVVGRLETEAIDA